MKIDLHVHASERSGCSSAGEEQLIRAAIAHGLDGLVFTDHHRLVDVEHLDELNNRHAPFRVFGGIEISLVEGEDVIVLGLHDPSLEERDWTYPEVWQFVRDHDGFLALVHPFRYSDHISIDIQTLPPDAIEAHSIHINRSQAQLIDRVREDLYLPGLCNSDAHRVEHVGIYCNEMEQSVETQNELLAELRAGAYSCWAAHDRIAAHNRWSDPRRQLPFEGVD